MNWDHLYTLACAGLADKDRVEIRMNRDKSWWLFVDVKYEGEDDSTSLAWSACTTLAEAFADVEAKLREALKKRLDDLKPVVLEIEAVLLPGTDPAKP